MKNKASKLISLILSMLVLATACICPAITSSAAQTYTYYVANGGSGDGSSPSSPLAYVGAAITDANAKGATTGDTIVVNIVHNSSWNTHSSGLHGMAYWMPNGTGIAEYAADLVVQAENLNTITYLAFADTLGENKDIDLKGNTTFKNLTIVELRQKERVIISNGYNVTFDKGTEFCYYDNSKAPSTATFSLKSTYASTVTTGGASAATYQNDVNMVFNSKVVHENTTDAKKSAKSSINIGGRNRGNSTYKGDVNITFNNPEIKASLNFGNLGKDGVTTVEGNVNVNIKAATSVTMRQTFYYYPNSGVGQQLNANAYQVILSGDVTFTDAIGNRDKLTFTKGEYYLYNNSGYADLLTFTDMAGKYKVADAYSVTATDKSNPENVVTSSDGELILTAGEWDITAVKDVQTKTYYVKRGGSGDGSDESNPAPSVRAAIEKINDDGLIAGDTAIINIVHQENWDSFNSTTKEHNMAYWSEENVLVDAYSAKLIIQGDSTKKTYLGFTPYVTTSYKNLILNGPTEFRDITLYEYRMREGSIITKDEVVFGKNTAFAHRSDYSAPSTTISDKISNANNLPIVVTDSNTSTFTDDINVTFENDFKSNNDIDSANNRKTGFRIGSVGTNNVTFSKDVNVTLNNKNAFVLVNMGNQGGSGSVTVNGNININMKSASGVRLANTNTATPKTGNPLTANALQVIISSGTLNNSIDTEDASEPDVVFTNGQYYLYNDSGYADAITFSDTAGTFNVSDGYSITATNKDDPQKVVESKNGQLILTAGSWDLAVIPPDMMAHIVGSLPGPLASQVYVTPGATYVVSFAITNNVEFDVVATDEDSRETVKATGVEKSADDKGRHTLYTYEVTIPETYEKDTSYIGVKLKNSANYDCYAYGFSIYKKGDDNKKELYSNPKFESLNLAEWWYSFTNLKNSDTRTDGGKSTTVTLEKLNTSKFPGPKMAHIKDTTNKGPFGQRVAAKANDKLTVKFSISNNAKFDLVANHSDNRKQTLNATVECINAVDRGRYADYEYEITMPADYEKSTALIGVMLKGTAPYNCYITNLSIINSNGDELAKNGDFKNGALDGWDWKYVSSDILAGKVTASFNGENPRDEVTKNVTLEVMDFDTNKMQNVAATLPQTADKMMHIQATKTVPIGQRISVKSGDELIVKVVISNNAKFEVVANDTTKPGNTVANGSYIDQSGIDYGSYSQSEYKLVIPQSYTQSQAFIGVKLKGDCYLVSLSVTKASAPDVELTTNGSFKKGTLDSWACKYVAANYLKGLTTANFDCEGWSKSDKNTTLTIVKLDQSKMENVAAVFPDLNPKMAYIETNHPGPFGQCVTVENNETYVFKFDISNNANFEPVLYDNDSRTNPISAEYKFNFIQSESKDHGRYSTYTYEVTIPDKIISLGGDNQGNPTNKVVLGIRFKGSGIHKVYFTNASFYKKGTTKEILKNGDFFCGELDSWVFAYKGLNDKQSFDFEQDSGNTKNIPVHVEVMRFDQSKMENVAAVFPDPNPKMVYIKSTASGPIAQQVTVDTNETYIFKFDLSNTLSPTPVLVDKDIRHNSAWCEYSFEYIPAVDHGRYTTYTYELKFDSKIRSRKTGEFTNTVIIGVKVSGSSPYTGYFANASLVKKSNPTKEILKNADFFSGYLDSWVFQYRSLTNKKSDKFTMTEGETVRNVELQVMRFDQSKMENVAAVLPDYSHKMIYFRKGAKTEQFAARVASKPGKQFIISYSVYTTYKLSPSLNGDEGRANLATSAELLSEVKHDNYTTYTYKVTVPETYKGSLVFLGVSMPFYAEGYLFDMKAYVADDAKKKDVWSNGEFIYGFNDWTWGWSATWFSKIGDRLKYWTDGTQEIKIVPYNLKLIDDLIADINRDDGEWWKPSDIISSSEEEQGVATLSGTFVDQNGKPLAGVELILRSMNKTYTAITDTEGNFIFKDIVADFYELYYINSEGQEVLTDFSYVFENGDKARLTLVSDTSALIKSGNLSGTVYTASLKTVPKLKVYLRGVGKVVTDEDGRFSFADVPEGEYELYTVLEDGSEYIFRTVQIKDNADLSVKLKYDPQSVDTAVFGGDSLNWLWIIIAVAAAVIIAAGMVIIIVLKKKRAKS